MRKMPSVAATLAAIAAAGAVQAQTAPHPHAEHSAATQAAEVQTTPSDGWMGSTAPTAFRATFPHPMQLTALSLKSGSPTDVAVDVPPATPATTVNVPLPSLAKGDYVLTWSARDADGHVMNGVVRFMVH